MKLLSLFTILIFSLDFKFSLNQALGQTQPVKEWTVLVFLNADNDLYQFGYMNMAQMEKVGSSAEVNVVVQFDPEPAGMPTSRYYITKNNNPVAGKITSPSVETLGETDMGSSKTLSDFLAWGVKNYPAKKYAVIIWNHGNGWKGVSYDDNPKSNLSMPDLRVGLESMNTMISQQRQIRNRSGQIDLINFDACIMSALEVAYELKDSAKFMVGSQFNEPGEGENYTSFLTPMVAKPSMAARELSEILVYQYSLNYQNRSSINYAAIDLSRVNSFVAQLNSSIGVANGSAKKTKIKNAFGSGSFDLVSGFNAARSAAGSDAKTANAIDAVIVSYGYPADAIQRVPIRGSAASITRYFPSEVYFRYQMNGSWQKGQLQLNSSGAYEYKFPNGLPTQYYVSAVSISRSGNKQNIYREALTSVIRNDSNPIVFHNQFPESSPLVADSYSQSTRGAHGMTMYSLAGMASARYPATQNFGREMMSLYKELLFSKNGASNWTAFFGL